MDAISEKQMNMKQTLAETHRIYGYAGKMLRVDLTKSRSSAEVLDEAVLRKYVGGASLGIKYLHSEVDPSIKWSDPENRLFLGSGPLGGTRVGGSGAIAIVSKGPLTNGIASTQANGFFGAFIRFAGFDSIMVQGAAPSWVYLYIHDGIAEIKDAKLLFGKDTFDVESIIKQELREKKRKVSILSIGPAGENLVKFACIATDMGHIAAHNGVGAVMGSKKLKAIVVERSQNTISFSDQEALSDIAKKIRANTLSDRLYSDISKNGTLPTVAIAAKVGFLPVKNYTSGVWDISADKLETYSAENIRRIYNAKPSPCWACASRHCHKGRIAEGKYAGREVEEPEYEGLASFSALVGIDDVTTTIVLANEVDRLGLDTNESGWTISWVMECYEKGILTKKDTDGLEMTWGNAEAIMAILHKIAAREGIGDILAEGVMRASRHIGGEAPNMAIHTLKGNTPRTHDHRVQWLELFDTCVSNTGTLESHSKAPYKSLGLPEVFDTFDPETVSTLEAKIKGAMVFEDSAVTCRYQTGTALALMCDAINAATGWDMDFEESMTVGKRAVNLARIFNLNAGIGAELDAPSMRYGSTRSDGAAAGQGIMPHWDNMLRNYYKHMGWDEQTGEPLPQTLSSLDLDFAIRQ